MPNQPKTPVRTVRIPDSEWEAMMNNLKEASMTATDAIRAMVRAAGYGSAAEEVALEAAFPGLPEGMTMDEARRRVARAVTAASAVLHEEWAEGVMEGLAAYAEPVQRNDGSVQVMVPLDRVRREVGLGR